MAERPIYDGETEIIPRGREIILNTRNKIVKSDITIDQVSYSETTNTAGGTTVYIGGTNNG